MIIKITIFILLFVSSFSLLTRKMVKKSTEENNLQANYSTVCRNVNLTQKYNYSDIVRSGYLNVGKGNSVLSFIFYGKKGQTEKTVQNFPTIIWLNGGPGSSSQIGNLQEIGPLLMKKIFVSRIQKNNYTWANNYNLLFIDQPVGTGLSFAESKTHYVTSMDDVANDFYYALNQLYNNQSGCFHKSLLNISASSSLFIFGQSYGGKYVPAIAKKIVQEKKNKGFLTGLKGIGIGDGFTSPFQILSEVGMFSYHLSLIDYQERGKVQKMLLRAARNYKNKEWDSLHEDFDQTLQYIVDKAGDINIYDIRQDGDYEQLVEPYFKDPEILKLYALEEDIIFDSQAENVFNSLSTDFMKDEFSRVQYLLNQSIPVLIYNGQDDLIVQTPGTMRWVQKIHYKDSSAFANKDLSIWKVQNEIAGSTKTSGLLSFYVVNNAGHLVPMDSPKAALNMMTTFVNKYK